MSHEDEGSQRELSPVISRKLCSGASDQFTQRLPSPPGFSILYFCEKFFSGL